MPVELPGYKRAFCNRSPLWDNKSTATLINTGNAEDIVKGIAFRMTWEEVAALDPYEGYPHWYNRLPVSMRAFRDGSWTALEG